MGTCVTDEVGNGAFIERLDAQVEDRHGFSLSIPLRGLVDGVLDPSLEGFEQRTQILPVVIRSTLTAAGVQLAESATVVITESVHDTVNHRIQHRKGIGSHALILHDDHLPQS